MGGDHIRLVMDIDDDMLDPASASRSSAWSISGRPPIATSGFGIVSVIGRSLVPSPAANTIAERGAALTPCPRNRAGIGSRVAGGDRASARSGRAPGVGDRLRAAARPV